MYIMYLFIYVSKFKYFLHDESTGVLVGAVIS